MATRLIDMQKSSEKLDRHKLKSENVCDIEKRSSGNF